MPARHKQLAVFGSWQSPYRRQRLFRNNANITDRNTTLGDALDSINHVCHIHDRSRTCLEKSDIPDFCLASATCLNLQADFQFICHHQQRSKNLAHSLECLHDTRLLVMLYFHIADRCRGFGILDDVMRRYENAYFF